MLISRLALVAGVTLSLVSASTTLEAQQRSDPPAAAQRKKLVVKLFSASRSKAARTVSVAMYGNFAPDEAWLVVQRIASVAGVAADLHLIAQPAFGGARAGVTTEGQSVIVYDPAFIDSLNAGGAGWSATSLLAHELGHVVRGHFERQDEDGMRQEMEADEFAGQVMARLGATLPQAQAIVAATPAEALDLTEMERRARLAAIARGFEQGRLARASSAPARPTRERAEDAVREAYAAVDRFVDALRRHQPATAGELLAPDAVLVLIAHRADGTRDTSSYDRNAILSEATASAAFDERTINRTGQVEGDNAVVLHYYNYYVAGVRSHCGGERYSLRRVSGGAWRIVAVEDHQVNQSCPATP